jgi:stage V sporulation protein B
LASLSAWSFSGACIISAVIVIVIFIWTNPKQSKPDAAANYYKPLLKSALPITGVRVVSSVAFPIISVILPLRLVACGWDSVTAVSHFGIIVGMMFPLLTIPSTIISSLATALVPELSSSTKKAQIQNQIKKSINFTIFINFLFSPVFVALGQPLGEFLFGNAESGTYLARSAWAMIPLSLSQITSAILNSLGYEKTAMRNYFIGSVGLFFSVWFLPSVIGADAVVVGLGVSTAIAVILNVGTIKKITQSPSVTILPQIFAFTLIAIPTFLFAYFTHNILPLPPFFTLSITGASAVLIFVGLAVMLNLIKLPKRKNI